MKRRDEGKARDILAATLQEVEAVGLAGLSMEAVARRAGVATGTLYIYFKNKEALLDALYLAAKSELSGVVFRDEGLPVRPAFVRMVAAYVTYLVDHRAEVTFMHQMAGSPLLSEETRVAAALGTRPLTALIERGKRELLLKDLDTDVMLAFLHGALGELSVLVARAPKARRAELLDRIAAMCWDAVKS